jgi:hypothetical protein
MMMNFTAPVIIAVSTTAFGENCQMRISVFSEP